MSRIITLEGIDGTGKGTQTRRLKAALEQRGLKVGEQYGPVVFPGSLGSHAGL